MTEVVINNRKYFFEEGFTVLQACEKVNVDVPKFCFHDKLSIAGNCRMCLVEIEKFPKPIASCAMPLSNGMVIYTDSPLVKKARESVLEFLLANHPLDCPICDQGGICDLQDQSLHYGSDRGRHYTVKRGVEDKQCGPIIKTVMTRCIHCTRCVRFAREVCGNDSMGAFGRGNSTEIGTYIDKLVKTELSGNLVDLCPVGALTAKPSAFVSRGWELKHYETVDFFDALTSPIDVQTRQQNAGTFTRVNKLNLGEQILDITPTNSETSANPWISDKTRFAFDGIFANRLDNPILYKSKTFEVSIDWKTAPLVFVQSLIKDSNILGKGTLSNFSRSLTLTNLFNTYQFLKLIGNFDINVEGNNYTSNLDYPQYYRFSNELSSLEQSDFILTIGTNMRFEASILNSSVRSNFLKSNLTIIDNSYSCNSLYKTIAVGNNVSTLIEIVEGKHQACRYIRNAKFPLILIGNFYYRRIDSKGIFNLILELGKQSLSDTSNWKVINHVMDGITSTNLNELGFQSTFRNPCLWKINNFEKYLELDPLVSNRKYLNAKHSVFKMNMFRSTLTENQKVILPTPSFYEQESFLINIEGKIKFGPQILTPFENSRPVHLIIKSIIKQLYANKYSKYFSNKALAEKLPRLKNKVLWDKSNINFSFHMWNLKPRSTKIFVSTYQKVIKNFYMSDVISSNSQVMAECSLFLNNKTNFDYDYN